MSRPMRVALFTVGGVVAAASIGTAAYIGLVAVSSHDVKGHNDFLFSGQTLTITSDGGEINLVPGDAGVIKVDRTTTESINGSDPEWELSNGKLRLDTNCPSFLNLFCDGKYDVQVPKGVDIVVRDDNGSIHVNSLAQNLDLRSDNGSIHVNDSRVDNLRMESDNGSISVNRSFVQTLNASSDNGSFNAHLNSAPVFVKASSDNGSLKLYVPEGPETYKISASTDNGSKDIGSVRTAPDGRPVTLSSDNGSVKMGYWTPPPAAQ
ncbi:DUF4097 family beta strand repeat-containing protein [Yinghuangia seranimata]|uniref:DUF4097 family beta strand repeat-containing protein n=1 Tax=Yinghuangia seranimata TaxID=408067 RepID=UPI00248ACCDF|nr:DUF4097 family beta strand repeat-containing protein [Yinghuangia seranimata]MDI2128058.1 DUF4097 family beta strand repeat-containing protein [Yinghuangia seranimata]